MVAYLDTAKIQGPRWEDVSGWVSERVRVEETRGLTLSSCKKQDGKLTFEFPEIWGGMSGRGQQGSLSGSKMHNLGLQVSICLFLLSIHSLKNRETLYLHKADSLLFISCHWKSNRLSPPMDMLEWKQSLQCRWHQVGVSSSSILTCSLPTPTCSCTSQQNELEVAALLQFYWFIAVSQLKTEDCWKRPQALLAIFHHLLALSHLGYTNSSASKICICYSWRWHSYKNLECCIWMKDCSCLWQMDCFVAVTGKFLLFLVVAAVLQWSWTRSESMLSGWLSPLLAPGPVFELGIRFWRTC